MMDKQMIEEMEMIALKNTVTLNRAKKIAMDYYNAGYRKIPENAVVLTREEYKTLKDLAVDKCHYDCPLIDYPDFEREKMLRDDTRKETAEKFAERLKARAFYSVGDTRCVAVHTIDEICKDLLE